MEEIPMEEDLHGNCNLFEKIHVSVICSQFQILLQKMPSSETPTPSGGFAWILSTILLIFFSLPFIPVDHLAPPLTPSTLPPKFAYNAIFNAVAHLDRLVTLLTPPNLFMLRKTMGYVQNVGIYSAVKLKLADAIHKAQVDSTSSSAHAQFKGVSSLDLATSVTSCSQLPSGPGSCEQVSRRLTRLLRDLSSSSIFKEAAPKGSERWLNSQASEYLRADHPDSLREVALNFGGVQFKMFLEFPNAIVTGEAPFDKVFGENIWDWYSKHPEEHSIFDNTMRQMGRVGGADAAIAKDVPWASLASSLVDVGGGQGEMLATIMKANPSLKKGIVFDMPHVIERSMKTWAPGGGNTAPGGFNPSADPLIAGRVGFVDGDMFMPDTIPAAINDLKAAHASKTLLASFSEYKDSNGEICTHSLPTTGYLLRDILHDWHDEDCVRILSSIRAVMRGRESHCYKASESDKEPVTRSAPSSKAFGDRILLVARVVEPGAGFVNSLGSTTADLVMLGAFGSTAGERTQAQFEALFDASGLELVAVHPTRSHYKIVEAKVKEPSLLSSSCGGSPSSSCSEL